MRYTRNRYETVTSQADTLRLAYKELGRMLNCSPGNIAIMQSATAAWMQVLHIHSENIIYEHSDEAVRPINEVN